MAALNLRNRSVVFRVTEQEYNSLKSACQAAGRHSLSDYTRSQLLLKMQTNQADEIIGRRFLELDEKLTAIQRLTQQLVDAIRAAE